MQNFYPPFQFKKSTRRIILLIVFSGFFTYSSFAQGNVILSTGAFDNCMAPTPNSGTYIPSGTMNGKTQYVKGASLRIIWTGTAWAVQGEDPAIGGINWSTGWHNNSNTAKPPSDCWIADFGCFPITLSGDAALFTTLNSIDRVNPNPTALNTINFKVSFSTSVTTILTSNFTLSTTGVTGASIASVSKLAGNDWNVAVNTGSGNGTIRLNMANTTGASHALCSALPFAGASYTVNKSSLPLQLISFAGIIQQEKTILSWTTTIEVNTKYFEVQRSINGSSFNMVDNVSAAGNYIGQRNYQYTDDITSVRKQSPALWYRLKMIDKDGKFNYSNIIMINSKKNTALITALPNPFGKHLSVFIESAQQAATTITLHDLSGKMLNTQKVILKPGSNTIRLNQLNALSNGNYILKVQNAQLNETIRLQKAD
ncbi:MAG: T9SS type A sorting domain-containing protein [Bacteroidota bacterium]